MKRKAKAQRKAKESCEMKKQNHLIAILDFVFFAFLFFIDRFTKTFLAGREGCALIFCLAKAKNKGISLGLLSSGLIRYLIITFSLVMILIIFFISFFGNKKKKNLFRYAAIFALAGIIGNLFDRVFYGYVIDWLSLSLLGLSFNLADCYLWIALILCVIFLIKKQKERRPKKKASSWRWHQVQTTKKPKVFK
ncbi:MAG: signal peptidase II [Candidatus Pacearchaeota archaeon]